MRLLRPWKLDSGLTLPALAMTLAAAVAIASSAACGGGASGEPERQATDGSATAAENAPADGTAVRPSAEQQAPSAPALTHRAPARTSPSARTPANSNSTPRTADPSPEPTRTVTLQQGAAIPVRLSENIDSGTATSGQTVQGEVTHAVVVDGVTVVPSGARVNGTVGTVQPAKHFGGQALVTVQFDSIELPGGRTIAVEGAMSAAAKKQTAKDAGTIAGSAVGGAILGKIIGKDGKDARTGAVIGGAIGTAVAARKGDEALLAAGTETTVTTTQATTARGA